MRKYFVFLSMLLLSIFIVVRIQQENQQLQFLSYNAVDIVGRHGDSQLASREDFFKALNDIATEQDSTIARRIVEPQENGDVKFVYDVYGKSELPKDWERASKNSAETSDLVNSYLIVSGRLTSDKLADVISQQGYNTRSSSGYSIYYSLYSLLSSEEFLISLVLNLLTFLSLTLIYRIKDLRSAGIRRVSGQSLRTIIFLPLVADGMLLFLSFIVNVILGLSVLLFMHLLNGITLYLFLLGLILYTFILFSLSLFLSLVYVLGLKAVSLVEVLKGKLPLKRLLALMLIGQLASIVVVGWTVNRMVMHYNDLQVIEKGVRDWDKNEKYFQASYSYGSAFNGEKNQEEQNSYWYQFAKVVIQNHSALLVKNNLDRYLQGDESDGIHKYDYVPSGHTIFVSPNYLEIQNIHVPEEFIIKMQSLQKGEFGLIIPDKLKGQEGILVPLYVNYLNKFGRKDLDIDSSQLFEFQPYITYVESDQSRFVYNTVSYILEQYLVDPIIVVMTPESTGDTPSSHVFWGAILQHLFLVEYQHSIELLKEQGVYQWVSYLLNSKATYYANLNSIRNQFLFLLLGSLIGVATSVLLFNTMNLVYFEQFRREIFIRRLAGMTFIELHFMYLLIQLLVFGIGIIGLVYLTSEPRFSMGTGAVFLINLFFILFLQERRERKIAYTVLQGG